MAQPAIYRPMGDWVIDARKRSGGDLAWFLAFDTGIVRHAAGPDVEHWDDADQLPIRGPEHYDQLARAARAMGGADITLVGGYD